MASKSVRILRVLMFSVLIVVPIFSIVRPANAQTTAAAERSAFCAQIDEASASIGQLMLDSKKAYDADKATRSESIAKARTESDKAVLLARQNAEKAYADQYKALSAIADTDAEKDAATAFKKTMTAAVSVRRKTIDNVLKTYRTGIDKVILQQGDAYATAVTVFGTTASTVLSGAKNECTENPLRTEPSTATLAGMRDARSAYQKAIAALTQDASGQIDILTTARDSSMATAETVFRIALETAIAKARAVFAE